MTGDVNWGTFSYDHYQVIACYKWLLVCPKILKKFNNNADCMVPKFSNAYAYLYYSQNYAGIVCHVRGEGEGGGVITIIIQ